MEKKPKVSIILTSYNHEKFIRDAITSALNQTFTDFELIIWDDHSTDNSWEIIQQFADPRIVAIQNPKNLRGGNIKRAIQTVAKGEYIAIHHSDDIWELEKLEKQVHCLDEHPEFAAVFTHVSLVDEEGMPFHEEGHHLLSTFDQPNRTRFEWLNYFFHNGNALCHPSVLIRREAYTTAIYRNGLTQFPDFDMWVQLCFQSEIHILQEKLVRFRIRAAKANTSSDRPDVRVRMQFEYLKILDQYRQISDTEELLRIFPEAEPFTDNHIDSILYPLGMISLKPGTNKPTQLFGLNLLFEALNHPELAEDLQTFQGFGKNEFVRMTAEHDVFSVESIRQINQQLAELERKPVHFLLGKIHNFLERCRKSSSKNLE